MSIRPTKKQRELLSFIENFIAGHGYGPSYREVMRGMGYKSVSTVAIHIDNLITRGHLRKQTNSARSLEVVNGNDDDFEEKSNASATQEKWLVSQVDKRFKDVEISENISKEEIDNLYVLVGALRVLELEAAVQSFLPRLSAIKGEKLS